MGINKRVTSEVLSVIITGMEHSGTTLLSQLFSSCIPRAGGGFECGLLLSKDCPQNFRNVHPFYEWLCGPAKIGHWGFSPDEREFIISVESWQESYRRLLHVFSKNRPEKTFTSLIDKTPSYCYSLSTIINRTTKDIPIFVTEKNIASLYKSYQKRKLTLEQFRNRYNRYLSSLRLIQNNKRVFFINHSELTTDFKNVFGKIQKIYPELGIDLNQLNTNLDYRFRPLKAGYDLQKELETAENNLSGNEKMVLETLKRKRKNLSS